MRGDEAAWRGETGELPPIAEPGSEVLQVNYRLPNQKDPFEKVDSGPIDQSIVEGALDISNFDRAPVRPAEQEEVHDLGVVLDFSEFKAKKEADDISASIKEALARFQGATTDEEKQSAFTDIRRMRGDNDQRLAA